MGLFQAREGQNIGPYGATDGDITQNMASDWWVGFPVVLEDGRNPFTGPPPEKLFDVAAMEGQKNPFLDDLDQPIVVAEGVFSPVAVPFRCVGLQQSDPWPARFECCECKRRKGI